MKAAMAPKIAAATTKAESTPVERRSRSLRRPGVRPQPGVPDSCNLSISTGLGRQRPLAGSTVVGIIDTAGQHVTERSLSVP